MKTNNIIKGLQTLAPYYAKPNGFNCGAEHDAIYAYATDMTIEDNDIEKMIELGWHQEYDELDCNEDFSVSDYRQDESWVAYT
jgi:hypothetical protein